MDVIIHGNSLFRRYLLESTFGTLQRKVVEICLLALLYPFWHVKSREPLNEFV